MKDTYSRLIIYKNYENDKIFYCGVIVNALEVNLVIALYVVVNIGH